MSELFSGSMPDEQAKIAEILEQGVEHPAALFWQYDQPAIIMGCSQRPDQDQLMRAEEAGLSIQRRRSGGGAVLAGPWMLSVTLFLPTGHPVAQYNIIEIFGWFEQLWIKALTDHGVPCKGVDQELIERSKKVSAAEDLKWACYASLSHGEVVSPDGRKLVGLAQIRKRKGIALVSGLHLSACDWSLLSRIVVNNETKGQALESLNADAQQLADKPADELLMPVIQSFLEQLPEGFQVIS